MKVWPKVGVGGGGSVPHDFGAADVVRSCTLDNVLDAKDPRKEGQESLRMHDEKLT